MNRRRLATVESAAMKAFVADHKIGEGMPYVTLRLGRHNAAVVVFAEKQSEAKQRGKDLALGYNLVQRARSGR